MKILAFTDTHGSAVALRRIEKLCRTKNPDMVVCCGDISIFEHGIVGTFRVLNRLDKPVIIVHGNHENAETFARYSGILKNLNYIHKKHMVVDNHLFLGYGGDGFSIVDRKFEKLTKDFEKAIRENRGKKVILVSHAPPYKTKVDKLVSTYCGNKSIRGFIDRNNVDLHFCGHIHENSGKQDKVKTTKIINPGPFGKIVNV